MGATLENAMPRGIVVNVFAYDTDYVFQEGVYTCIN